MKIFVDNAIATSLATNPSLLENNPKVASPDSYLSFNWPALFCSIDLSNLFDPLTVFEPSLPFFQACILTLSDELELDAVHQVYDGLFAENLTQIKNLKTINAASLLSAINAKRAHCPSIKVQEALADYAHAFEERPSQTVHDLLLYFAWDRMCVWLGRLFDHQSTNTRYLKNIKILKECLIESYQHIRDHERAIPGLYRLVEALCYYELREENLQKHTSEQWNILSQGLKFLKPANEMANLSYIDEAVCKVVIDSALEVNQLHLTYDSPDAVAHRIELTNLILDKVKAQTPEWNYTLLPQPILHV